MMEANIKVIKSDWSDKTKPFLEKVQVGKDGYGRLGFYFLDDVHHVRVWVTLEEAK